MRIGHDKQPKRLVIPKSTTTGDTGSTTGLSEPLRLMDSSGADSYGPSDQEPSSGASSAGTLTAPLTPTPRYGFLCFRERSPRTV